MMIIIIIILNKILVGVYKQNICRSIQWNINAATEICIYICLLDKHKGQRYMYDSILVVTKVLEAMFLVQIPTPKLLVVLCVCEVSVDWLRFVVLGFPQGLGRAHDSTVSWAQKRRNR